MSKNKMEELINADTTVDTKWHGITVQIKKRLSLKEMMTFVNNVVVSCFAEDTEEYLPEVKDFATRCSVLEIYADIELPKSLTEKYDAVYGSDIVSFVLEHVDHEQFSAVLNAIDDKIDYRAQSNIEALNQQMNEVISRFSELEQTLSGVFSRIDADTITKLTEAIVNGGFDEQKLVEAFSKNMTDKSNIVQMPKKDE